MSEYCLAIVAVLLLPQCVRAATYHVAQTQNASDDNPGTEQAPWLTISGSLDQLRAGDRVVIHEGTYREWVAPEISGTPQSPITFIGTDRDRVVLTGADVIGDWQRLEGPQPIYSHEPWTAKFQVSRTEDGEPIYHHPQFADPGSSDYRLGEDSPAAEVGAGCIFLLPR